MNNVLTRFNGVRRGGKGFKALCPTHPDEDPSLSISEGRGGIILLNCFGGCDTKAVLDAVGLKFRDLYP